MSDLQFAVGMSRKWDPEEAGREAAKKAIAQLNDKPKFILIFCTIHYDNERNGLKKMLRGCRSLINENVTSVGGTIAGFACFEGCYTRGVVVVAASGDMDVVSAYEKNIFRHPIISGKKIGKKINDVLNSSKRKNKVLFDFLSGPVEPALMANEKIVKLMRRIPGIIADLINDVFLIISIKFLQYGPSVTEEVLENVSETVGDGYMIGNCSSDNMKVLREYEFHDNDVLKRSIVTLGIKLNNQIIVQRGYTVEPTNYKMKIERGRNGFSINKIEGRSAGSEYIKRMGWPEKYREIHTGDVARRTYYYALGFRDGVLHPFTPGFFLGENIWVNTRIHKDEIETLMTSSSKIIGEFKNFMKTLEGKKTAFTFIGNGMNLIGIHGEKINLIKNIMDENLKDTPYLVIYGLGEHLKDYNEPVSSTSFTIVMLSILKAKE